MPNSPSYINHRCNRKTWSIVCKTFANCPSNFDELRTAILSYKEYDEETSSFSGLKKFLEQDLSEEEQREFFTSLLPGLIRVALSVPSQVPCPLPILRKGTSDALSLSQKQIGVLLANAFLCTFPDRLVEEIHECGHGDYPDINFNRLFQQTAPHIEHKFRCILSYFRRITETDPVGVVTFNRRCVKSDRSPSFVSSAKALSTLSVHLEGAIEGASGHLQVDFADKYVGGLVVSMGCVQEEIRFLVCPELIAARVFTPVLGDAEALVVTGVEQYSRYEGYARTFHFCGSFEDKTPRDACRRRCCQVVAIDALSFHRRVTEQYKPEFILRDMLKAYAGFCPLPDASGLPSPIATGNWGCGAFCGSPRLKSLIQWLAASEAGRDVAYFAFGKASLVADLAEMRRRLAEESVTVGELTRILLSFWKVRARGKDLYAFIYDQIDNRSLATTTVEKKEGEEEHL